jgi:ribosomal protein L21E
MIEMGDRVRVVLANGSIKTTRGKILNGATGTVKDIHGFFSTGIEFDDDIGGSSGRWGGKDGHCWYVDNECLENIEESEVKEMSDLKIGDRVKVVSEPTPSKMIDVGVMVGMTGTVKELGETYAGVEFDEDIGGHCGDWNGKSGYCWYIVYEHLEKIEEAGEETKADTLEQKILTALREEIGVEIGEEFDVYKNGKNQWTCKFEKNEFTRKVNDEFQETGLWKSIVGDFGGHRFKKKPFVPKYGEDYFFLAPEYDKSKGLNFRALQSTWIDSSIDDGMLAVGNIFRTKEEALKRRDKLLEKPNELSKGE